MEIDSILEKIKQHVGNKTALALWEMHSFGKGSSTGFCFKSVFQIKRVIKQNERIKVIVDIELIDCWDMFEKRARQVFIDIIKEEMSTHIPGIENSIDIVFEDIVFDEGS